jgi:hypothetical protein
LGLVGGVHGDEGRDFLPFFNGLLAYVTSQPDAMSVWKKIWTANQYALFKQVKNFDASLTAREISKFHNFVENFNLFPNKDVVMSWKLE